MEHHHFSPPCFTDYAVKNYHVLPPFGEYVWIFFSNHRFLAANLRVGSFFVFSQVVMVKKEDLKRYICCGFYPKGSV